MEILRIIITIGIVVVGGIFLLRQFNLFQQLRSELLQKKKSITNEEYLQAEKRVTKSALGMFLILVLLFIALSYVLAIFGYINRVSSNDKEVETKAVDWFLDSIASKEFPDCENYYINNQICEISEPSEDEESYNIIEEQNRILYLQSSMRKEPSKAFVYDRIQSCSFTDFENILSEESMFIQPYWAIYSLNEKMVQIDCYYKKEESSLYSFYIFFNEIDEVKNIEDGESYYFNRKTMIADQKCW